MKQYHDHLRAILEKGSKKPPAREGMPGSLSLFGYQTRYNLSEGFPILTTKKMSFKNIVTELLWFLRGDTNIKYLVDNGCNIWNEDAYTYYLKVHQKYSIRTPFTFEMFIDVIKRGNHAGEGDLSVWSISDYKLGDCGYQYGKVWRDWEKVEAVRNPNVRERYVEYKAINQLEKVIQNIKTKPFDRRKVITAIDPAHDEDLALYWCHCLFQFNCREMPIYEVGRYVKEPTGEAMMAAPRYYLDCQLYQRSADMFLGVPYNISSYALLTHIIAKLCNMVPGDFIHTFGDSHIYDNHREQVDLQLVRDPETYKLPSLLMSAEAINLLEDDNLHVTTLFENLKPDDFMLMKYESYPAIKAELSTGMKK